MNFRVAQNGDVSINRCLNWNIYRQAISNALFMRPGSGVVAIGRQCSLDNLCFWYVRFVLFADLVSIPVLSFVRFLQTWFPLDCAVACGIVQGLRLSRSSTRWAKLVFVGARRQRFELHVVDVTPSPWRRPS